MRYAILTDIHANLEALQAVARSMAADRVDRVACLGDIVGYHADASAYLALMRTLSPIWIAGNHDRAVTGQITLAGFSRMATKAVQWTRSRLRAAELEMLADMPLRAVIGGDLLAVHGAWHPETGCEWTSLDNDEQRRLSFDAIAGHPSGARICAFGHTHMLGVYRYDGQEIEKMRSDNLVLDRRSYYLIKPGQHRRATVERSPRVLLRVRYGKHAIDHKADRVRLLHHFTQDCAGWAKAAASDGTPTGPIRTVVKRYKRLLTPISD